MRQDGKAPSEVRGSAPGEDPAATGSSVSAQRSTPNDVDARTGEIDQALREELGESVSPKVLEHVLRPRNAGLMANPDGEATLTRTCGDGLCIQLRLQEDWIQDIRFMTNGCGAMVACGSVATELARGKGLREALRIDERRIMDALEGLPPEEAHCATLAANALKAAVRDALVNRTEPWKRLYKSKWGR